MDKDLGSAAKAEQLPCADCPDKGICRMACHRLHKFLREDPECHTKAYTRETVVDPHILQDRIPDDVYHGEDSMWHTNVSEYWDIMNTDGLSFGDKELWIDKVVLGMSHVEMLRKWKISKNTLITRFSSIKKQLIRLGKRSLLG